MEAPRPASIEPPPAANSFAPEPAQPPTPGPPPPGAQSFPANPALSANAAQLPYPVAELPPLPTAPPQHPGTPAPPAPEAPRPAALLRFAPPALHLLAALLTVGGLLLPLFQVEDRLRQFVDGHLVVTETAWGVTMQVPGQEAVERAGVPFGIPLVAAVVLLVVAAVAALSRPGRELGRWLVGASAVFTAGVVFTVGMNRFELTFAGDTDGLDTVTAAGMWLLIVATVLAAVAAVVAYLPFRRPGWSDPSLAYADTPTPPSGVAITVLPPDDEEPRPPLP
ncbi:hypothetical protein [Amycolatopsis melonis]|uniref:hypothetical protein n=1 Tax=Amycolatopsis melonis TaxID=3156488 RepID=UPI0032B5361F